MKNRQNISIYLLLLIGVFLFFASSCKKNDDNNNNTNLANTFTDARDGNIYKTVTIGNQLWMAENLKYMPSLSGMTVYGYEGTVVDEAKASPHYTTYGVLYNWDAATKVCPAGWHLPNNAEWEELVDYLGGESLAGGKLKETGTAHWVSPNTGATNETGFTALAGGNFYVDEYNWTWGFEDVGKYGHWWSATKYEESAYFTGAWYWSMYYNSSDLGSYYSQSQIGDMYSIRCVKDGPSNIPVLTTTEVTEITMTKAISGGAITSDGGATVTASGVCWSTSQNPTTDDNKTSENAQAGSFISTLIGLTDNTTYYVRAYAINRAGTGYGSVKSFTTLTDYSGQVGTFTDIDGNIYNTIGIGSQVWMAENLRFLPSVVGPGTGSTTTPYYYVYGYEGTNVEAAKATTNYSIYGVLYNWSAAKNACPAGWHLPTDAEWTQLTTYLGGESIAGGKLKEIGTTHWNSPNTGATNETGFTALPGGGRGIEGAFDVIGVYGNWWSATEASASSSYSWARYMNFNFSRVDRYDPPKDAGFSVRCVRD